MRLEEYYICIRQLGGRAEALNISPVSILILILNKQIGKPATKLFKTTSIKSKHSDIVRLIPAISEVIHLGIVTFRSKRIKYRVLTPCTTIIDGLYIKGIDRISKSCPTGVENIHIDFAYCSVDCICHRCNIRRLHKNIKVFLQCMITIRQR